MTSHFSEDADAMEQSVQIHVNSAIQGCAGPTHFSDDFVTLFSKLGIENHDFGKIKKNKIDGKKYKRAQNNTITDSPDPFFNYN